MSAPLNQPIYAAVGDQPNPTPEDPRFTRSGVYVEPTYNDLSATGIHDAPAAEFPAPSNQLGEQDYASGRFASGADVDRHIYPDDYHGPSYGELGPRPFPN
jgi:hypothetical protein